MSVRAKKSIFPLHMTPFESYMFVDDQPEYPMTFVLEFEFSGRIDRAKFQSAIDKGLERHPLLRSTVAPAKSNRDCWVTPESFDSKVRWGDFDEPIHVNGAGVYLNLRETNGFRCWVRHDNERARLTAAFHHTACDGLGAYQFIGDVFWFYAKEFDAVSSELIELPEANLRRRLGASMGPEVIRKRDSEERIDHEPAQVLAPRSAESIGDGKNSVFPRIKSHVFDKDQYKVIRLDAQDKGQTINDRLLESVLATSCAWNDAFGDSSNKSICINMPLDLRQPDHPVFSATNVVTCSFVRRQAEEIKNRDSLIDSLRQEAMQIKHNRLLSPFMQMLVQAPLDMHQAAEQFSLDDCLATVVFSNTGDPTKRFLAVLPREKGVVRVGNLMLEYIQGTSPLRTKTRAAVASFTYRRELRVCVRTDPHFFTDEDSTEFLNQFVERFEHGSASPPRPV